LRSVLIKSGKTFRVVANDEVARSFVAYLERQNSLHSPNCNCWDLPLVANNNWDYMPTMVGLKTENAR
jgi:hypothetical protein